MSSIYREAVNGRSEISLTGGAGAWFRNGSRNQITLASAKKRRGQAGAGRRRKRKAGGPRVGLCQREEPEKDPRQSVHQRRRLNTQWNSAQPAIRLPEPRRESP